MLEPSPTIAGRNSVTYLHCTAKSDPEPTITWYGAQGEGQEQVIQVSDFRNTVKPVLKTTCLERPTCNQR